MIILHFVSGLRGGGVEQFLKNYTFFLNKDKQIKEYIIFQHTPNSLDLKQLKKEGNICIRIVSKIKHPILNFIQTVKLIYRLKPDIVHTHMNLLNFIPLFAATILGVKVRICHSHIAKRNIKSKAMAFISKKLNILFSNVLISCGKNAGVYMFGNNKFTIINNAIFKNKFIFNVKFRNGIRRKLNIDNETLVLGSIGRLTHQKNQFFLLDILFDYKKMIDENVKLLLIGSGELKNNLFPDLFTKICKIPIKHMLHAFDGYFAFSPFKCTKRASALI